MSRLIYDSVSVNVTSMLAPRFSGAGQSIPLLPAGNEGSNSQNNRLLRPYCQDNELGWRLFGQDAVKPNAI